MKTVFRHALYVFATPFESQVRVWDSRHKTYFGSGVADAALQHCPSPTCRVLLPAVRFQDRASTSRSSTLPQQQWKVMKVNGKMVAGDDGYKEHRDPISFWVSHTAPFDRCRKGRKRKDCNDLLIGECPCTFQHVEFGTATGIIRRYPDSHLQPAIQLRYQRQAGTFSIALAFYNCAGGWELA